MYKNINEVEKAFKLFNLDINATEMEIKKRHRELVKKYHTDELNNEDTETIKIINASYDIIKNYLRDKSGYQRYDDPVNEEKDNTKDESYKENYEKTREEYEKSREEYENTRKEYEKSREEYEKTREEYKKTKTKYKKTKGKYDQYNEQNRKKENKYTTDDFYEEYGFKYKSCMPKYDHKKFLKKAKKIYKKCIDFKEEINIMDCYISLIELISDNVIYITIDDTPIEILKKLENYIRETLNIHGRIDNERNINMIFETIFKKQYEFLHTEIACLYKNDLSKFEHVFYFYSDKCEYVHEYMRYLREAKHECDMNREHFNFDDYINRHYR